LKEELMVMEGEEAEEKEVTEEEVIEGVIEEVIEVDIEEVIEVIEEVEVVEEVIEEGIEEVAEEVTEEVVEEVIEEVTEGGIMRPKDSTKIMMRNNTITMLMKIKVKIGVRTRRITIRRVVTIEAIRISTMITNSTTNKKSSITRREVTIRGR
jgi:hypothetical protein